MTWQEAAILIAFGGLLIATLIAAWLGVPTISKTLTRRAWSANTVGAFLGVIFGHWVLVWETGFHSLWAALVPVYVFAVVDVIAIWVPLPRKLRNPGWAGLAGALFGYLFKF